MSIPIFQVDAFTARPFAGNPAAVCLLPAAMDAGWMQAVAAEMNLAETAFLVRRGEEFDLRWFTPEVEVDLCGHATLASAHTLWETGAIPGASLARFHTRSALLTANRRGDWIEMDFPATLEQRADPPPGLLEGLGVVTPHYVGRNRFDYLVHLASPGELRTLSPDHRQLRRLGVRGVIVTSESDIEGIDFVSRFFAPGSGVAEDHVTGSAHCCLAPYWGSLLGRIQMAGRQLSPRGGEVRVRLEGERVILGGQAVTTMRGELAASALPESGIAGAAR